MANATIISRYSSLWAQENNSIIARPVNLGTWNVVRVGILWSLRQDVFGTAIDPDFGFGLCSGTAATYGDASATHFVGVTSEVGAFGLPWQAFGNFLKAVIRPTKQVGVTKTNGTNLTVDHLVNANTGAVNNRSVTFIEFTKGSPNYSFKLFCRNLANASNPSHSDFVTAMEAVAPVIADHVFTGAQTLAVNEGVDGTLNAISLYWPLTTTSSEIDEVMVVKMS